MIDNYELDENGVLHQKDKEPMIYNTEYISSRYNYPDRNVLANLRLGYIVGSIGRIPSSLLDLGFGDGTFLDACSKIIPWCCGYDLPSNQTPIKHKRVDSIPVKHSSFYEVVTLFDVLEHIPSLEFVKEVPCRYMVVSVPSCNHPLNSEWLKSWKHLKPNEHLHHFNRESLSKFMYGSGYETISITSIEDCIRIDRNYTPNIITGVFKK
jgi:hypothetical protein